jgi:N-methylhydantoinase A
MGPDSAGATPGPACYGRGGTRPTCTDADVVLGSVHADDFLGGRFPLDAAAARTAVASLAARLARTIEHAAAGMVSVIDANMAAGIRHVTVERGHDPRDFLLVVGGGAGPVHAAGIARELGLTRILVPRNSSLFCAAGLLLSDLRHDFVRSCVAPLERVDRDRLGALVAALVADGRAALAAEGVTDDRTVIQLSCDARYLGQHHEITVPWLAEEADELDLRGVAKRFHDAHDRLYGYALAETPLELVNVRAVATGRTPKPALAAPPKGDAPRASRGRREVWMAEDEAFATVPAWDGEALGPGATLDGPAIVPLATTTVVVPPGWRLEVDALGSFVMERR